MKLSDIKTREQFDFVSNIWYNRTIKLRNAWINSSDYDYIAKSFRLFIHMHFTTINFLKKYSRIVSELNKK